MVAERAAAQAAAEGISVRVLDLRSLVPLDTEALREAVGRLRARARGRTRPPLTSGFGAEVVATIQEEAFWSLEAPIGRVAAPDTPYPIASVEELYVPSVERVLAGIRQVVGAAP